MSEDNAQLARKGKMTDEERIELCTRLDQELEDFIDGLEKKRYTEGWPEDRWEEVSDGLVGWLVSSQWFNAQTHSE